MRILSLLGLAGLLVLPLGMAQQFSLAAMPISPPLDRDDPDLVATLRAAQAEIKGEKIYACIDEITKGVPTQYRVMGTPTHDLFREKYKGAFTALSPRFKTHVQHFDGKGPPGVSATPLAGGDNLITVLPGKNLTKWVVIGGHYDTREGTAGGAAIDNTSGICTVLEIARAVEAVKAEPEATMVFAWWDGEEWGLYGSTNFVKDHSSTKEALGLPKDAKVEILAGMSFDIVGINYPARNTWVGYGDSGTLDEVALLNLRVSPTEEQNLNRIYPKVKDSFEKVRPAFLNFSALEKEIAWKLLLLPPQWADVRDDQYGRSDQVPFIAAGIPGMRIQGSHDCDANNGCEWPHYHQPSDTLETAAEQAGGKDLLVKGFETAAEAGGLTAIYIGLKGGLGDYAVENVTGARKAAPKEAAEPSSTPDAGLVLTLVTIGLASVLLRRRG